MQEESGATSDSGVPVSRGQFQGNSERVTDVTIAMRTEVPISTHVKIKPLLEQASLRQLGPETSRQAEIEKEIHKWVHLVS